MSATPQSLQICPKCWERAVDTFGTGKIFVERATSYRRKLNALAYLGIVVPATVGVTALTYGLNWQSLSIVAGVAAFLGIVQLLVSISSIVNAWPTELEYSNESGAENLALSARFKNLAQTAANPPADLQQQFETLVAQDEARSKQDSKKGVTERELRKAHRYGLRQYQRRCVGCETVPTDMKSTNCGICGRF